MAKSTKAQEASTGTSESFTEHELSDPEPTVQITRAMLGGEPKLVGTRSSQPSESESPSSGLVRLNPQEPAPTTESHSNQSETEGDSDVPSTDGDGQTTETESVEGEEIPPYEEWAYADLQTECKNRGLSARGSAEDLVLRLMENDEAEPQA